MLSSGCYPIQMLQMNTYNSYHIVSYHVTSLYHIISSYSVGAMWPFEGTINFREMSILI